MPRTLASSAFYVEVGKRIRALRMQAGLTQMELAAEVDVTYQQMHKYEMGINRLPLDRADDIAAYFNVPLHDLLPNSTKPLFYNNLRSQRRIHNLLTNFPLLEEEHQQAISYMIKVLVPPQAEEEASHEMHSRLHKKHPENYESPSENQDANYESSSENSNATQ